MDADQRRKGPSVDVLLAPPRLRCRQSGRKGSSCSVRVIPRPMGLLHRRASAACLPCFTSSRSASTAFTCAKSASTSFLAHAEPMNSPSQKFASISFFHSDRHGMPVGRTLADVAERHRAAAADAIRDGGRAREPEFPQQPLDRARGAVGTVAGCRIDHDLDRLLRLPGRRLREARAGREAGSRREKPCQGPGLPSPLAHVTLPRDCRAAPAADVTRAGRGRNGASGRRPG